MRQQMSTNGQERVALAEAVRDACVDAALAAYENARIDGLCHEGAWEVALGAMQRLNVQRLLAQVSEKAG